MISILSKLITEPYTKRTTVILENLTKKIVFSIKKQN